MGTNNQQEARRYKRWDIFEYALITTGASIDPEPVIIVDLSLGGFQCRSKAPYSSGEICIVSISRPDGEPLTVRAEVRYVAPIPQTALHIAGMRFNPASVEQRVSLVNYIHERFQADIERIALES